MIVYGPIPSRRLGQSIGINNIPPKTCSYSCIYCQIGRTNHMQVQRQAFYAPETIVSEAQARLAQLAAEQRHADYFSFVPDGEPTLDINLGKTLQQLRPLGVKTAVITNASLLWMDAVKQDLLHADWVSVSLDAADEPTWCAIDRPHGALHQQDILRGIREFAAVYQGTLVTETMLVQGINNQPASIECIAEQIAAIRPSTAYLLVPTRPPAEPGVARASAQSLQTASAIIRSISGTDVECITGDEAEEGFFVSGNIADDLLGIASVHPIREDIADTLLTKRGADHTVLKRLLALRQLEAFTYEGKRFYRKNTNPNG